MRAWTTTTPSAIARAASAGVVLAGLYACAASCGGVPSLPRPKLAPHVSKDLFLIPAPPPPAKVELVPALPSQKDVVWIDGEWTFRGRRPRWRRGRWVVPVAGAKFAPWTSVRGPDGKLWYAHGKWVDARGEEIPAPAIVLEAEPSKTTVVGDFGDDEDVGRDISEDGGASRVRDAGAG